MAFCTFHGNEEEKIDKLDLSSCFTETTELTKLQKCKYPTICYSLHCITNKKIIVLTSTLPHSTSDTEFLRGTHVHAIV